MIKWLRSLFRKKTIEFNDLYHTSIETISVFNWGECTTGKIEYTRKQIDKGNELDDVIAWDLVYDSYLERYGISDAQVYLFDLQTDLAMVRLDLAETGDKFLVNKINVLIEDIKEAIERNSSKGMDMGTIMIVASKWIGYKLPEKDTTIRELHDILNLMKKEYNQNKEIANGNKEK